jgi:hypothetical protein
MSKKYVLEVGVSAFEYPQQEAHQTVVKRDAGVRKFAIMQDGLPLYIKRAAIGPARDA